MLRWLIIGGIVFVFVLFWQFLFNLLFPRHHFTERGLYYRRLSANLVIGIGIALFLNSFSKFPLFMDVEDASLDLMMQIHQNFRPPLPSEEQVSFVFLDIDDQTYHAWGEPLFTPRNHLKSLIEVAVNGGARLVVVDVDLSQETPTKGLQLPAGHSRHPYDQTLYDYIANYKSSCQEQEACPPIILTRVFRPKTTLEEQFDWGNISSWAWWANVFSPDPIPIHEIRSSFLDSAAIDSKPYVQWGSPLFWRSSYDGAIRRWWLWQPTCENEQADILPSLELLAAAMVCHQTPGEAQASIEAQLSRFKPAHCQESYYSPLKSNDSISLVENCLTITTGIGGIQQRIRYNLPWHNPSTNNFSVRYSLKDQEGKTVLTVYSARTFLKEEQSQTILSRGALKNKIVVIAGSYSDARDIHPTPLDQMMPGGLIVINAIYSLLQGEIEPLLDFSFLDFSVWWWIMIVVSIVAMSAAMSYVFTKWDSFWGLMITGTAIIAVMVPISLFLFEQGLWLNFAIPLLAVQFHHIAADFQKMAEKNKAQKFKSYSPPKSELAVVEWQSMTVDLIKTMSEHQQQFTTELQRVTEENRQIVLKLKSIHEQNEQVATDLKTLFNGEEENETASTESEANQSLIINPPEEVHK